MSLIDSASLIVTPNAYKEGTLYSVIPSDGSGDLSVTRATTATRVNSAGLVELVPYNLLTYSEQFDNAAWINENCSETANALIAPDGTMSADYIVEDSTPSTQHRARQVISGSTNAIHTFSVYVKQGVGSRSAYIDAGPIYAYYNFSTGVVTAVNCVGSVENVGNDWYRFIITSNSAWTPTGVYVGLANGTSETYSGNGTSSIAFWGAQLVEGSVAKDYQKTETRLNIPRLDYSNGTCPSILVEPQRTNLLSYSEQFDNAYWTKTASTTITSNSTISPNGIQNADTYTTTTSGLTSQIYRVLSTTGTVQTLSIYIKYLSGSGTNLRFSIGSTQSLGVDLTFSNSGSTLTGVAGASVSNLEIKDCGNNWFRVSISVSYASSTAEFNIFRTSGTGTDSYAIWGAQFEAGSYPTSYIPTTSASVTRNADTIFKTAATSLIGQTEGTIFVDVDIQNPASIFSNWHILMIGSQAERITIYTNGSTNIATDAVSVTGGFSPITGSFTLGRNKIAVAYKANDVAFYVNGNLIGTRTTASIPLSMAQIDLGGNYTYGGYIAANQYNAAALWKTRLTNDELERLTGVGFNTYTEMANYYNYIIQ